MKRILSSVQRYKFNIWMGVSILGKHTYIDID